MKTVKVTDEQKEYTKKLVRTIMQKDLKNKGDHARQKPEYANLIGFLGEVVFADEAGLERPAPLPGNEVDDGYDYYYDDKIIDVKSSGGGLNYGLILFKDFYSKGSKDLHYVKVNFDSKNFEEIEDALISDLISKQEVVDNHYKRDFGYGERVFVPLEKIERL